MRISEVLTESQQLDELDIGKGLKKLGQHDIGKDIRTAGSAVGKAIGGVGQAVGAVAGVPQGLGRAIKKGYKSAVSTIGGEPDQAEEPKTTTPATDQQPTAPSAKSKPQSTFDKLAGAAFGGDDKQSAAPRPSTSAQQINKQGPKGTAPAVQQTGTAAQALQKTAQATADQNTTQAGQTLYAQVKASVNQLDKKGKQRILQLLQKSLAEPTPTKAAAPSQPTAATTKAAPQKLATAPTAAGRMAAKAKRPAVKKSSITPTNPSSLQSLVQQQVAARNAKQTAAGGTVTQTPRGYVHTAAPAPKRRKSA